MHHAKKHAAALAVAAALCLAVPAAAADYEPWTYEVDDVMGTYGVEYYSDVGFEMPQFGKKTSGSSTSTSTQSAATQPAAGGKAVVVSEQGADSADAAANGGISVYRVDGINVYSAGNEYAGSDFTVTIPAEVVVNTTTNTGKLPITGTLDKCRNLEIEISSQNNYKLICGTNGPELSYDISDKKIVFWKGAGDTSKKLTEYDVNVEVKDTPTMSGTYTDLLTFTINPIDYTNEKPYKLKFDTNASGDTVTISTDYKFVKEKEKYGVLPTPRRDYYDFDGWYTEANGGTKITEDTTLDQAGDTTIYAHWRAHILTINYHNDGAQTWQKYSGGIIVDVSAEVNGIVETETVACDGVYWHTEYGILDVNRFTKEGYRSGFKWKVGSLDSTHTVRDTNWTETGVEYNGKYVANFLGFDEEFKKDDVVADLYPVFVKSGKMADESDADIDAPIVLLPELDETKPIVIDMPTTDTDAADTKKTESTASASDDIYDTVPAPSADGWYDSDDYTGSDWTGDDLVPLLDWE